MIHKFFIAALVFVSVTSLTLSACSGNGDSVNVDELSAEEGSSYDQSKSSARDNSSSSTEKSSDGKKESSSSSTQDSEEKSTGFMQDEIEAVVMPSGTYDDLNCGRYSTEDLNQEFLVVGKYGEILDVRDSFVYKTVQIGNRVWMAQNLHFHTYNTYFPRYSGIYWGDELGFLYTWSAAMDSLGRFSENGKGCGFGVTCSPSYPVRGICPKGWHLPTKEDWIDLIEAVGDSIFENRERMLKSTSSKWDGGAGEHGTDEYGFSAIPAGFRDEKGDFYDLFSLALFWHSDETDEKYASLVRLRCYSSYSRLVNFTKDKALSIRCVKD